MLKTLFMRCVPMLGILLYSVSAKTQISGTVVDVNSQEPLPFVIITGLQNNKSMLCDINGSFIIPDTLCTDSIIFHYNGYKPEITCCSQISGSNKKIEMMPGACFNKNNEPANNNKSKEIIGKVIEHIPENKTEMLQSYAFTAYEKLLFTFNFNSPNYIDSILNNKTLIEQLPQLLSLKPKRDDHDLFLYETVRNKSFIYPDNSKDEVVKIRASGFKRPAFTFLTDQMQTYTIYNDYFILTRKAFVNPVSAGNYIKYDYTFEDELINENNDTVFIVSFEPKKTKPVNGLKGQVYINSRKYAVQYFIAEEYMPYNEPFEIKIIQQYKLQDNKYWFPDQLHTYITFNNISSVRNFKNYFLKGIYKSYILDPEINAGLDKKEFSNIALEIREDAHIDAEKSLQKYRISPLSDREIMTYQTIDSLGNKYYFDYVFRIFERSMLGFFPLGPVDLDMNRVLDYNNYEGIRIGIGATTNQLFSKFLEFDGYIAYGNLDRELKYGYSSRLIFNRINETSVRFTYKYDIMESGGISFFEKTTILSSQFYRHFFLDSYDLIEKRKLNFESAIWKHFQTSFGMSTSFIRMNTANDYTYTIQDANPSVQINEFQFTELEFKLRFAYKEKFTFTPNNSKFVYETKYPVIHLNMIKGVEYLDGDFKYLKLESKIYKKFRTKYIGISKITIVGGIIFGDLPFCKLYNGQGSYSEFSLESENSFATMRSDEFLSDRFLIVYFRQNLGRFLPGNNFLNPNLVFVSNMQFGSLDNIEKHNNVTFRTLENGYFESGLLMENIIKARIFGFGFGAYYRYGPYSFNDETKNIALRLTLSINL